MDQEAIKNLSSARRHQECLKTCQQLVESEPNNPLPWKYAGKSLLALGQVEKAQQCLLKAHQLDSSDPEIVKDIGNISLNLDNKDAALGWYEKALEINNDYAPAFNNIANIKRQLGNHQESAYLFKRAIQADPKLIQAYVGAAASFLALGDLDQAGAFATQALAINVRTPGVNEILGIVYQNKSKPDQAIECYQKELEVNPQAINSLLNLGLLLLQKGKAGAAVKSLVKASTLAPSEQCSLLLAQAYQNLGQFKEAVVEYKRLDIDQANNKMIPFNFGLCLLNTGNNIDAIEAFQIAIQLDELFVPAWGNLGTALMNEGRHQQALPVMQKAHDLDPDNPTVHMNLGGIYKDLGQLDQALAATLKSLELKPDNPDAHMNLGGIYRDLGKLDQALAAMLKSLELKPDNPDSHINLGWVYKELGQLDQALASTLKSLDLKPDNPMAHMNLGGIYRDLGKLDQALAAMLKSLELKPDNPDSHINLGWVYKELGQLDQALAATLKSLELKPDNPTAHVNLAGIYIELGCLEKALAPAHRSIDLNPDDPDAHLELGEIYKVLGNLDRALASTLKSLDLKPDHHRAQEYLGNIYFEMGLLSEAEEMFDCAIKLNKQNLDNCLRGKAACFFAREDYYQSIEILKSLTSVDDPDGSPFPKDVQLKSALYAKIQMGTVCMPSGERKLSPSKRGQDTLCITAYRSVGEDLVNELYAVDKKKLAQLSEIEARRGEGFCTDYKLFTRTSPNIQKLEIDLRKVIYESLGKETCSLKYDSFFNIFKMGAASVPHNHLREYDERFNLWRHKYSLVYYVDPGDQDCEHPGILKIHDPEIELLPKKGLIVIIPASRKHSSFYGGSKDRLMVGANFYAFSPDLYR